MRAGRHFANARRAKTPRPPAPPPPPPGRRRPPAPALGAGAAGVAPAAAGAASFSKQACDLRPLGRGRLDATWPVTSIRWPPVLILATIFGTVPSWWTRAQHRPARDRGDAVERGDLLRLALRERELRARQEEVVDEVRAGLAELREVGDRGLVRLEHVAGRRRRRRTGPTPPVSCCGESVTVRSVPMLESGSSAVFCAWSSPRESAEIAITSATPIARPSSVRIVRPLRRSSSLRR